MGSVNRRRNSMITPDQFQSGLHAPKLKKADLISDYQNSTIYMADMSSHNKHWS